MRCKIIVHRYPTIEKFEIGPYYIQFGRWDIVFNRGFGFRFKDVPPIGRFDK